MGVQLFVDLDVTTLVGGHTRRLQAKIVGVRPTTNREHQMRAGDAPRQTVAVEIYVHALAPALHSDASGVETDLNPLLLQNLADRVGDVGAADQPLAS